MIAYTNQTETPSQKSRSNKVGTMSDPTALPALKKSNIYLEAPVSPSLSSKNDLDLNMANELFLDSFSQQDKSIELRHRAMAYCTESSTLPLLTMGKNIPLDATLDTLAGEDKLIKMVTTSTIVMVEEPSQASKGKYDSLP